MNKNEPKKQAMLKKKSYAKPQLKSLGSVRGLTLKVGSLTDSGLPGNFN